MRFKSLSELKRPDFYERVLATLPQVIAMAEYAMAKAFKINELVLTVHQGSYEWYGYTIADRKDPELIVDIGLPKNDQNLVEYTSITPENIAAYQEALPTDKVINGWIHSHGSLGFRQFSSTDEHNQVTVLHYVTALLRKPVAKKEVVIKDLLLCVKDRCSEEDFAKGNVLLITDAPVREARILETIYGGFCYAIVVGDDGWHEQAIHYKTRGILSGQTAEGKREAEIILVDTGRSLTRWELEVLAEEVKTNIQPMTRTPERFERGCT
ncbi:MAG: hypothetical protein ACE5IQ_13670 [Candidatus Methylomirabilales bacterium]